MNDYTGLAPALLAGVGIGELPPVVQPELVRDGRLVEVMPNWPFRTVNLSVVHVGNRYIPRAVRVFKEFAVQMAPTLFPTLRLNRRTLLCIWVALDSAEPVIFILPVRFNLVCRCISIPLDLHCSELLVGTGETDSRNSKIRHHFGKYRTADCYGFALATGNFQ